MTVPCLSLTVIVKSADTVTVQTGYATPDLMSGGALNSTHSLTRSDAYSVELVLLNKRQNSFGGAYLHSYQSARNGGIFGKNGGNCGKTIT